MFIDINRIAREGLAFEGPVTLGDIEGLGGEAIRVVSSRLGGTAVRSGRGVEVAGRLVVALEIPCSRCLEPFPWSLDAEVAFTAVPVAAESEPKTPPVDDDSIVRAPGGRVDLTAVASEMVYLNLPLKPICRPDCRGLCPTCRANLNQVECGCRVEDVDPRLAPLLAFRRRRPDR